MQLEDPLRKTLEIEGCWIIENQGDGIKIINSSPVDPDLHRSLCPQPYSRDLCLSPLDQLLSTRLTLTTNELLLNRGSGVSLDGGGCVGFRVCFNSENVVAENKSGYAIKLGGRGQRLMVSVNPSGAGDDAGREIQADELLSG